MNRQAHTTRSEFMAILRKTEPLSEFWVMDDFKSLSVPQVVISNNKKEKSTYNNGTS